MANAFQSSQNMLAWQYRSILEELNELQRHASDPSCPCVLSDAGEYCLHKHTLGLHTLAKETGSMDATHNDMLETMAEEALAQHNALKDRITCGKQHKDEKDTVEWARQWRKKIEPIYYACGRKRERVSSVRDPGHALTAANVAEHVQWEPGRERVIMAYTGPGPQREVLKVSTVSIGGRTSAPLPVAGIIREAKKLGATGIVAMHNHPSGASHASGDDIRATKILGQAAQREGIKLLDHVVKGDTLTSFREKGLAVAERVIPVPIPVILPGRERIRTKTVVKWERVLIPSKTSDLTFAIGPKSLSRYEFRYRLVEADKLRVSHNPMTFVPNPQYPQELQPRDRTRAADQAQVILMAAKLDPEVLLVEFHSIDRGAPIIGKDLIVESGNGRVMAIQRAIREAPRAIREAPQSYQKYLAALEKMAPQYAIPLTELAKFQHPVLVRERLTKVDRAIFGKEANLSTSLGTSPIETARADAGLLRVQDIFNLEVGENQGIDDALRAVSNAGFVNAFLSHLELNQRASIVDAEGKLNQEGIRRLTMAMFVRAFPGDTGLRLAEKFFESTGETVKNVMNGILKALGRLAQAEALVASGQRAKGLSIADDLMNAVNIFARIKADTSGMTVAKYLAQLQLQSRELTPFQEKLLMEIDTRSRSGRAIGELLNNYAQAVIASPPPQQAGLMGLELLSKDALLSAAARKPERDVVQVSQPAERSCGTSCAFLEKKLIACNLTAEQRAAIWNYRPLRDFLMFGLSKGQVQICQAGMVEDSYQITLRNFKGEPWANTKQGREDAGELMNRAKGFKGLKQIYTNDMSVFVFTIVLPRQEVTASEILGGKQFLPVPAIHGGGGASPAV